MRIDNINIYNGVNAAIINTTDPQQIEHGYTFSVIAYTTALAAGTIKVQVSNDPADSKHPERVDTASFIDLSGATATLSQSSSGIINCKDVGNRWMRLIWTPAGTSGNATITVTSSAHGMALTTTPTVTITGDSNAVISGAESATITTANAFTFIITETDLTSGTLNWSANFGKNGATYTSVNNLDGTFTITATSLAHGLLIGSTPTITVASATNSQLNGSQTATITTAGAFTFIVTGTLITTGSLNWSAVLSGTTKAYTPVLIAVAGTMSAQFNCKGA